MMGVQRVRLEGRRERAELVRRFHVPVTLIGAVDPTLIGVDPVALSALTANTVPGYLEREIDPSLSEAVAGALSGREPWFVVVVGRSKVGKSRTLFEALCRCGVATDLELVAPVDGEAVRSLLGPGQELKLTAPYSVLWLDDLEPFLSQGVTLRTLREWRAGGPGRIVAATYGGKGSERVGGTSSAGLATTAGEVLGHAREVPLGATTEAELHTLRAATSASEFEGMRRYGLAAYLVAGPALARKLASGRHAPGEGSCLEGVAVVEAAIDWARCGRTDPMTRQRLRTIWSSYLPVGIAASDDGFDAGLAWALRPVSGSIALLAHANGYQAYDYMVRLAHEKVGPVPPQDPVWAMAVANATPAQAFAVGLAAYVHSRLSDSASAFRWARESPNDEIASLAGRNLGVVLGELGRSADAVAAYSDVANRFRDKLSPQLRVQVAAALVNKAIQLGVLGRPMDEMATYEDVVRRFGDDPAVELCVQVAKALVNTSVRLAESGDRADETIAICDDVVDRYGDDPATELRAQVAAALVNKGLSLGVLGRAEDAVSAYNVVVNRYGGDAAVQSRIQVAAALVNNGIQLRILGRSRDAMTTYDQVVDRYGEDTTTQLRERVAIALVNKGAELGNSGRTREAISTYDALVDRYGEDTSPQLRLQVARALFNKGIQQGLLAGSDDTLSTYDQLVRRYGADPAGELRELVAWALYNKGNELGNLGRSADAVATYEDVVRRFGDDPAAALRAQVAKALVNKAVRLEHSGRSDEAISTCDDVEERYRDDPSAQIRLQVAKALTQKGIELGNLGRIREAVTTFEEVARRYRHDPTPSLHEAAQYAATSAQRLSERVDGTGRD